MEKLLTINNRSLLTARFLIALLFCGARWNSFGQETSEAAAQVLEIKNETVQQFSKDRTLLIVWWIPEEFLHAAYSANPKITAEEREQWPKMLRPYVLLAVLEGKNLASSSPTFETETAMRDRLRAIDRDGNELTPLRDADLSAELRDFLDKLKPRLSNVIGSFGSNLHFYVFPATDKAGRRLADPKAEGNFSVRVSDHKFQWRLPLGSVLPRRACPKCGEKLSGAFKFCPFDGTALAR